MNCPLFLLFFLGSMTLVWCRRPPFDWSSWQPLPAVSHFCTTYFNVKQDVKTYPLCGPDVDCENCQQDQWRWWCWWKKPCDSCCNKPLVVTKIVQESQQVCCPGYYGWHCDRAFCQKPCDDNKTDCTAPNTCGPVCYPPCSNGGTCVLSDPENVCSCTPGWTGSRCEILIGCEDVEGSKCQNGGTCLGDRCLCPANYTGVFCEKTAALCSPPCLNGGQCVNQNCTCVNGYSGRTCEIPPENPQP